MKKTVFALVLVILFAIYPVFAEDVADEVLTVENCEELAVILELKNEFDERIQDFAAKYAGRTIEFDGNIAYINNHGSYKTRYDLLIYAGDYSETSISGPNFQFSDVGVRDLGLSGLELPFFVRMGTNIHIVAEVEKFNDNSGLFMLDPISIEERAAGAADKANEELDASAYITLEKGSKGEEVQALQQRLIDLYYLDPEADGVYGKNTAAAVEAFQVEAELEVTGIADPMTQAVLFSDDAPENCLAVTCSTVSIGSASTTAWYVDGKEFTLKGNQTKTIKTRWGTYKFDAFGEFEEVED